MQTPIAPLPALAANTWYRLRADITKLTAASARIDVSFVQLDSNGSPTGAVTTGSVADTSAWTGGAPDTDYFIATNMWPSYKNHNATPGSAPADNTCYQVVIGTSAPRTLTVNVAPGGGGSVIKFPLKATYNNGESVQLTAVPATGYTFSNWSGDLTGNANPVTIVMDADKTITANCIAGGTVSFQYGASGYSGAIDTFIRGTTEGTTDYHTNPGLEWDDNSGTTSDEIALIRFMKLFSSEGDRFLTGRRSRPPA